jgi:hypothetical protein
MRSLRQEEGEQGHEDNREAAIEEMRRLEKPAKVCVGTHEHDSTRRDGRVGGADVM